MKKAVDMTVDGLKKHVPGMTTGGSIVGVIAYMLLTGAGVQTEEKNMAQMEKDVEIAVTLQVLSHDVKSLAEDMKELKECMDKLGGH